MPIAPEELAKRLAEADRLRLILRKATREMEKLGEAVREQRRKQREAGDGNPRPG